MEPLWGLLRIIIRVASAVAAKCLGVQGLDPLHGRVAFLHPRATGVALGCSHNSQPSYPKSACIAMHSTSGTAPHTARGLPVPCAMQSVLSSPKLPPMHWSVCVPA